MQISNNMQIYSGGIYTGSLSLVKVALVKQIVSLHLRHNGRETEPQNGDHYRDGPRRLQRQECGDQSYLMRKTSRREKLGEGKLSHYTQTL